MRNGEIIGYGGEGSAMTCLRPPNVAVNGASSPLQYIGSESAGVERSASMLSTERRHAASRQRAAGAQLAETTLTPTTSPAHVRQPHDRRAWTILAQPRMRGVKVGIPIRPVFKNLVFIATSEDVVYAFDADDISADVISGGESTKAVWRTVVGTPHVGDICPETDPPVVGITSTPVIDVTAGRMYVVARDQRHADGLGVDVLHALDIATGADVRQVVVNASVAIVDQKVAFNPACQRQRPGLLLQNGNVYLGYGTYSCDAACPDGPIAAGDRLPGERLLPGRGVHQPLAPGEGGMGIWASGNGLAGSSDGTAIFYETGNDIGGSGLLTNGDAFIKLTSAPTTLSFAARFQPANASDLRDGDTDLGSGGPMLLPGGKLVGGGKDGSFHVLPQSDLTTGATSFQAFYNSFHFGPAAYPYNSPTVYATECPPDVPVGHVANPDQPCWINPALYPKGESYGPNIHGGPVYWATDATHGLVYKMSEKDYLKAFAYDASAGTLNPTPTAVAPVRPGHDGMPGGFSSVSASGTANGIVWTIVQQLDGQWGPATAAILYAFDARTLSVLWSNSGEDEAAFAKFNSPTIADGRVFLPSVGHFQVYGLHRRPAPGLHANLRGSLAAAIRRRWLFTGGAPHARQAARDSSARRGGRRGGTWIRARRGRRRLGNISRRPMSESSFRCAATRDAAAQARRLVDLCTPKTGARIVRGEIRRVFLAQGGVTSWAC